MNIAPERVNQLKQFVTLCKATPAILNIPELSFFKEWLVRWVCTWLSASRRNAYPLPPLSSLGATIPEPKVETKQEEEPEISPSESDPGDDKLNTDKVNAEKNAEKNDKVGGASFFR